LIEPLGFEITEKAVRRAGLDYWPHVRLHQHRSWEEYVENAAPAKIWFFENFGDRVYTDAVFGPDDALVFGKETTGISRELLSRYPAEQILRIPIVTDHVRSLNLSNSVAIALYEARRQLAVR
jgi:tRNA (cytidine/uridine-2'-O-)-methyltransferase